MKIRTLYSGSTGNSLYIETPRTKVLIDAGKTCKALTAALEKDCAVKPESLDAVFVSHAHHDHTAGAGVMSRKYKLPLYATEGTWVEMEPLLGKIEPENRRIIGTGSSMEIKDLKVESFPTSHDALDSVGFVCTQGRKSVGIATDSGVFTSKMTTELKNVDCLIIESNHDVEMLRKGPYPWLLKKRIAGAQGHLSNIEAGKALLKVMGDKTKTVVQAHLSEENNCPNLALKTMREMLCNSKVNLKGLDIFVAPRHQPGPWVRI